MEKSWIEKSSQKAKEALKFDLSGKLNLICRKLLAAISRGAARNDFFPAKVALLINHTRQASQKFTELKTSPETSEVEAPEMGKVAFEFKSGNIRKWTKLNNNPGC